MACTLEKVLGDARTLLERLKEHDTAAEGLIEQSGALSQRVHSMREVGSALPDKVRTSTSARRQRDFRAFICKASVLMYIQECTKGLLALLTSNLPTILL